MEKLKIDSLINNEIEEKAMNMISGGDEPGGCCVVCSCTCSSAGDCDWDAIGSDNHANGK